MMGLLTAVDFGEPDAEEEAGGDGEAGEEDDDDEGAAERTHDFLWCWVRGTCSPAKLVGMLLGLNGLVNSWGWWA